MTAVQEATEMLLTFIQIIDDKLGKPRGIAGEELLPAESLFAALALVSVHGQVCHHMLDQLGESAPPDGVFCGMAAEQATDWSVGGKTRRVISFPEGPQSPDGGQVYSMALEHICEDQPS